MRAIDADRFKDNIMSGLYVFCQENKEDIARAIDAEPTVERPQGEWIIVNDVCCVCPFCENIEVKFSKYCPDCGARLKGGAE